MSDGGSDITRVAAAANRLRLVQIDLADEPDEQRRSFLREQIERELRELSPDERGEFLGRLAEMFPAWDRVRLTESSPESATESAADTRDYQDPFFLVKQLCGLSDALTPTQRQAVIRLLDEAGLVARRAGGWSPESEQGLRELLQIGDGQEIAGDRAMEVLQMLAAAMRNLDRVLWQTGRQLGLSSSSASGPALLEQMQAFATGSEQVSASQMRAEVERLGAQVGALIMAVGEVGRQFASRWAGRLEPQEIEALARSEPKPMTIGWEVAFWRKYKDIAEAHGLDQGAIEKEIHEAIREYIQLVTPSR